MFDILFNVIKKVYNLIFTSSEGEDNLSLIDKINNLKKISNAIAKTDSTEDIVDKITTHKENIYQDSKDARYRDKFLLRRFGGNFRANLMLIFICLLLILCLVVLIFFRKNLTSDVVAIISGITGALGQCLRDVFHFEFGGFRSNRK